MGEQDLAAKILIEQAGRLRNVGLDEEADEKILEAAEILWQGNDRSKLDFNNTNKEQENN